MGRGPTWADRTLRLDLSPRQDITQGRPKTICGLDRGIPGHMSYEHYTLQGLTLPPNAGQQQSQSLQSNTASLHNALVQQHHQHRQHVRQQRVRVSQQSSSAPVQPQQPAQAQQQAQQLQQSSMSQQQQQKYSAPPPVAPQPQQEEPTVIPPHMTAEDASAYHGQKGAYGSGEIEEGYSLEFQNLDQFMVRAR